MIAFSRVICKLVRGFSIFYGDMSDHIYEDMYMVQGVSIFDGDKCHMVKGDMSYGTVC